MWCQIVIHYDKKFARDLKTRYFAGVILRHILGAVRTISKRAFFLFEMSMEDCHNFVAFELKNKNLWKTAKILSEFFHGWYKSEKIIKVTFRKDTADWTNGEYFLTTICAHCDSLTDNYEDMLKQQPGRLKGLKGIHHLTHCMMNATFGVREFEVNLYKKMYKWYSGKPLSTLRKGKHEHRKTP